MTVTHEVINGIPTSTTTYNEEEWAFIDTLPQIAQNYIMRGLATPYTYGYKATNTK